MQVGLVAGAVQDGAGAGLQVAPHRAHQGGGEPAVDLQALQGKPGLLDRARQGGRAVAEPVFANDQDREVDPARAQAAHQGERRPLRAVKRGHILEKKCYGRQLSHINWVQPVVALVRGFMLRAPRTRHKTTRTP